jgi:vancomycin aglycone glucosyltransferase
MRVLLSTYDSRGGVEPLVALAVRLRDLGAEALVCAPPDCADRLARDGVPLVPVGAPVRTLVHGAKPPSPADVPRLAAELMAAWFDRVTEAAQGCDAVVASGVIPVVAGARSVAEKLGIPSVHVSYCPVFLPSPHHRPHPLPGRPLPPDETDNRVLWALNARDYNEVFGPPVNAHRRANGLPPVDDIRGYIHGDHPWLAADPVLAPWPSADPGVVQTGAWMLPDERPLPAEVEAFLNAGPPPVYVGFGSMRVPEGIGRAAVEAIRGQGHRALIGQGWAGLAPIDDRDDCLAVDEINQQVLFGRMAAVIHHGGAGTTTTAARAGVPQVVVPQWADQPYWASRVAELGIGVAYPAAASESLVAALAAVLTPQARVQAAAVARTIRADGAAVAARLLVDAISQQKPPVPA